MLSYKKLSRPAHASVVVLCVLVSVRALMHQMYDVYCKLIRLRIDLKIN